MKSLQYASYREKIYKKDNRSRFTFFLQMRATGVYEFDGIKRIFKSRLLRDMKKDIELFGDPYCELTWRKQWNPEMPII